MDLAGSEGEHVQDVAIFAHDLLAQFHEPRELGIERRETKAPARRLIEMRLIALPDLETRQT